MRNVAIVGAGLAGLVCADALKGRANVAVFEKSRGLGGRLATRRIALDERCPDPAYRGRALAFDHGTPGLKPSHALFAGLLSDLADADAAAEWRDGLFVGRPGMSDLVQPLAYGVDVALEARVDALERADPEHGGGWMLRFAPHGREGGTRTGTAGPFERVVLAVPAVQAARLLRPVAPDLALSLEAVTFDPCWTLMAAFAGEGARTVRRDPAPDVLWLVEEGSKPDRDGEGLRAWTLQMDARWSRERLDAPREAVEAEMLPVLRDLVGVEGEPLVVMAHRWLHSQAREPLGRAFGEADGLLVGGDWTTGPCADDAWASGKAMAARLAA